MLDETVFQGSRLCVVGNICRDVKTSPLPPDERLFADGEYASEFIIETIGGGGANSAIMAAGLGAEVRFVGKIGDDPLGTQLENAMCNRGVKSFIRRDPCFPTGSSMVLSFTNGCRHFISCQLNNNTFQLADIDVAALDAGGHLLRADVWFSTAMLEGGNAQLFHIAKEKGMATSLDLNWDPLWGRGSAETILARNRAVRDLLPQVDLVHGNVRELGLFTGTPDLMMTLERLTDWGAGAVVVHMGNQGAGYYQNGQLIVAPCALVERQIHTVGTGDLLSLCMILLHERQEIPPLERLHFANNIVAEYIRGKRELLSPVDCLSAT
jgi:sugar/nucleoside kinase (ribokinase family)